MQPLTHGRRTAGRAAGFTLVEMAITVTVVTMMLTAIGAVLLSSRRTYQEGVSVATLEARARRAVERLATELTGAMHLTLSPAPVVGQSFFSVDFRTCVGYAGGAPLPSGLTRLQLVADPRDGNNGLDDDSDGLTDECQVVLTRDVGTADQIQTVITGSVREYLEGETANLLDDNGDGLVDERGLSLVLDADGTLRIRLTLEVRDPEQRLLTRTVETSVHMRN